MSFDVAPRRGQRAVVVGGGLIGLMTAAELYLAGFDVVVFDAGEFAQQASWAGGGILCPLAPWNEPDSVWQLAQASAQRTREWALGPLAQDPVEWWESGIQWLGLDDRASQWLVDSFPGAVITQRADGFSGVVPNVAQIRTPRYGKAICRWLSAQGVSLRANSAVASVSAHQVVLAKGDAVDADVVCVAAGPWSGRIVPSLSVVPVRGQMLLFPAGSATTAGIDAIRCFGHSYVIPRRDGRVLAGSTSEDVGFTDATSVDGEQHIRQSLRTLAPALENTQAETQWSGLRPMLVDARSNGSRQTEPLIGPVLRAGGNPSGQVWVNTGHFRNGVTLAAASGVALAQQIVASLR